MHRGRRLRGKSARWSGLGGGQQHYLCGVTTYKAVKLSKIRRGQWIAIYGLGGLGNLALQYAKNVFNAKVIAIDVNDEQLKLATKMGADLAINSRTEDAAKIVQEKAGGAHAAVVTAVAKAAFNSAVDAVRAGGRVVAVGLPPESMSPTSHGWCWMVLKWSVRWSARVRI